MSVKPEGLLEDIKRANVFHHPVKAKLKSEFRYLYLHFMLSIKYQIFNCAYHRTLTLLFDIKSHLT